MFCGSDSTVGKTMTAAAQTCGPLPRWVALNSGVTTDLRDLTFFDDERGIVGWQR